jgi:propionate CoA-transferase
MLRAIGERFDSEGHPRDLTTLHPIAAGDMSGIKGVDHIAKKGLLKRIIGGSYPSGPSSAEPPLIWRMIGNEEVAAYNVPSGIMFDMHREAAAKRPGVLTKIGLDTFVDPDRQGCAMNQKAAAEPIVKKIVFEGEDWLYFPAIAPQVAIIRATTADERGNLTYEHEGAYLGGLDQALAARNNGGVVIAQVKRITKNGSLRPHDVRVPGMLVDYIVVDPEQKQTTQTLYDPAISGEVMRPLESFRLPEFNIQKVIARRVARELEAGSAVNLGFGISANVPRILLEEGLHGDVTWVIEQGAVGGFPATGFAFGCALNPEALLQSVDQFTLLQGGGFDVAMLSFLEVSGAGDVNASYLPARPHVTAGVGGFNDIITRAPKIVFSGYFTAGKKDIHVEDGQLKIITDGTIAKFVPAVAQISFAGDMGRKRRQEVLYVTERCVIELTEDGLTIIEIAPGVDLEKDVLGKADVPLMVSTDLQLMSGALFRPEPMGLILSRKPSRIAHQLTPHR